MKKFKITKGDRVYIVDAKSHIDAISKVKAVKDSSIKDYSPEVYVKELEKLIPEYQRLGDLKSKIRESLVSSGKMDKSKMGPDFKLILNDAKVQQWLKQVRELDKKWNSLLTNLNRFGTNAYKQQSNGSDLDVWLNSLPDSWTINDIKFAVKSESRKYKDSISQWNPGMSEIGLFQISYKRNGVYQSILVRANSEEQAKQKLLNNLNGVDIIGVNSHPSPHFHEPILDSSIKDINQVLLSNLEQVAQKGDAWRNKWKKLLDMTDKWNSYQWKELRNNDPKKYELIIRNKEYAEKEAEALNREWDRAIDALSRDRSFGRPGDYRMDLHSYKSRNDNYPMGSSQRYKEILYGYEQAEKSAREKKGLDSSIKDAYIEEWWGQSGENPNTVARRYGVSVKQLKRNNDQILYRFEGDINKLNRMHSDGYFMSIDMDGNSIKDSKIKDAYIEEWWGQSGENPNTVARRYGVSVKQLKRNNDQILYRFEGDINKLNRMHSDGYFMSIDMDGNSIKDSKIKDDGYYYLLRDAIDLLTKPGAARGWSQPYLEEVQEYMVQKGINPTNVNQWKKKYESLTKDSSIKDGWSGVRSNGVIFNYSNGKYTITHRNGKVETFPGNKFNTAEELFKYIDNIKDSKIKDSGINYGTLFIDLTSPNELTAQKIVQELKNEIGNNKIAEIRGGSFTPVSEHSDGRLDLDFKEFKNNEWGTNHITLMVRSSLPFLMKTMKDDPKYGAYKLRAELNSKLKQFANKTIYSNKSFTMDSAIKDEDYSKYLSIVKQLEKLVEPANRALQQKIAKYGVTKQDIRNNSPKYRDVCREIPELKVWAKLIMQLPGELAGFMPAHPSQESVDKLKKAVTNSKAFDSTIK